jgi:endonuclease YncB( thermonuclease family)
MAGKINRIFLFALLGLVASFVVAQAKEPIRTIEGLVIKVSDGDTINVMDSLGTKVKVRLYGIDAPETEKSNRRTGHISKPGQPYGDEASTALQSKVYRKMVKLEIMDIDRYKRSVGIVWLNEEDINQEMVAEGYAWAYRQYLDRPHASEYLKAEESARLKKLGIWQQYNPQPPWEFRKSQRQGY